MAGAFMPRVFAPQKLEAEKRHGRRFSANPLRAQTLRVCDGRLTHW
jgi:hypothetical protein